ncbi:MAG: hypothetical protein LBC09_02955, partial [Helicobacteraceae bacterium]|nr:hypothetical protein [Helicobacteraceae bacterium]
LKFLQKRYASILEGATNEETSENDAIDEIKRKLEAIEANGANDAKTPAQSRRFSPSASWRFRLTSRKPITPRLPRRSLRNF